MQPWAGYSLLALTLLGACGGGDDTVADAGDGDGDGDAGVSDGDVSDADEAADAGEAADADLADALVEARLDITVEVGGTVQVTPPGEACTGTCSYTYAAGASVFLLPEPVGCQRLDSWSGDCSGDMPCTLVMDGNKTVAAMFEGGTALDVTVPSDPSGMVQSTPGGIACPPDCHQEFSGCDEPVILTASENLLGWEGDCRGDCACELTMDESHHVVALLSDPLLERADHIIGEHLYPGAVAADAMGNTFLVGRFFASMVLDGAWVTAPGGKTDIFVLALDSSGTTLWARHFIGTLGNDVGEAIAVDAAGDVYVAGKYYGDVDFGDGPVPPGASGSGAFVAKYAGDDGELLWVQTAVDGAPQILGLAIDQNGDVVLTGRFGDATTLGTWDLTGGDVAALVAKLEGDSGDVVWAWGSTGYVAFGSAIAVDGNNRIVVAGSSYGTFDLGCGPIGSGSTMDIFIAAFDEDGDCVWSDPYSGPWYDEVEGLTVLSDDSIVMVGLFGQTLSFGGDLMTSLGTSAYVVRFDEDGVHQWSADHGHSAAARAVTHNSADEIIVVGEHSGDFDLGDGVQACTVNGRHNAFLAVYSADGDYLWSRDYGKHEWTYGSSVVVRPDDDIVLTGYFQDTVDFGEGDVTSLTPDHPNTYILEVSP
jgi:hypothetical protein